MIFGTLSEYTMWMEEYYDLLSSSLRGQYNVGYKQWKFDWGAILDLLILQRTEDLNKLKGFHFNFVEVIGRIDPSIQMEVLELVKAEQIAKFGESVLNKKVKKK